MEHRRKKAKDTHLRKKVQAWGEVAGAGGEEVGGRERELGTLP